MTDRTEIARYWRGLLAGSALFTALIVTGAAIISAAA